ncbi:ribonuclease HI [bacterium TMED277]|nr:MAG: ribonuclease HI [bacterium TMED277]
MSKIKIIAYTDGACSGNPGPGGWGLYLKAENEKGETLKENEFYGNEVHTTNNRMELIGAIKAIEKLKKKNGVSLTIRTDSTYVRKGITEWLSNWKKNNWCKSDKKPVENKDLWELLDKIVAKHSVNWEWVKGHSGEQGNEIADELARKGRDEAKKAVSLNSDH